MARRDPSADPSQLLAAHNAIVPVYNKYCTDKGIDARYDGRLKVWPSVKSEGITLSNEISEHFGEILRFALVSDRPCLVIDLLVAHQPIAYRDLLHGYYMKIGISPDTLENLEKLRSTVIHSPNWRFVAQLLSKIDLLGQLRPIVGNAVNWLE
jgi:hypothetical protein